MTSNVGRINVINGMHLHFSHLLHVHVEFVLVQSGMEVSITNREYSSVATPVTAWVFQEEQQTTSAVCKYVLLGLLANGYLGAAAPTLPLHCTIQA